MEIAATSPRTVAHLQAKQPNAHSARAEVEEEEPRMEGAMNEPHAQTEPTGSCLGASGAPLAFAYTRIIIGI